MEHFYQTIEGWFNMEQQYLELLSKVPEGGLFVELGAWKGRSTAFLATEIIIQGRNVRFITVDTFEGVHTGEQAQAYSQFKDQDIFRQFVKNINPVINSVLIFKENSAIAGQEFNLEEWGPVDALFVDASHEYVDVKADLEAWLPKMKPGGIIAGHDYEAWPGVKKAVNEFFTPDKIENDCWFKNL